MSVILDTNIFIRAAALSPSEVKEGGLTASRHDLDSSPNLPRPMVRPRECRALISSLLRTGKGIYVPKPQVEEVLTVVDRMRAQRALAPHNETLLACVSQFVQNAGIGNAVPVLNRQIEEQFSVLCEATTIAKSTVDSANGVHRHAAESFLRKHERFIDRALPGPNIEAAMRGRKPFVWKDWLLCHAAKRAGTHVVTLDQDFEILSEAYLKVTGYKPAKYIEYFPATEDLTRFREALEPDGGDGPEM